MKQTKLVFAHDAAHYNSKALSQRTITDKVVKRKAYETAENPNYVGYQRALASMLYSFFDKKKQV